MREFRVVDVFTSLQLQGNPVAVVIGADGLTTEEMQKIAAWTNLSETTFHLQPTNPMADYRLRIFTPVDELPFAGHPTLGSAHALIEARVITPQSNTVVQECESGLIPISIEGTGPNRLLHLCLPQAKFTDLAEDDLADARAVLGAEPKSTMRPAIVDVGPRWLVIEVEDAASVLALRPDPAALAAFETRLDLIGVTVFGHNPDGNSTYEVRSFAPSSGTYEDPVCGSGNGAVGAYLLRAGALENGSSYQSTQGQCVGRDGRIFIRVRDGRVHVGGQAVTTVTGKIRLPKPSEV